MNRRSFLQGAAVLAPAVILTPGLLMPVRPLKGWIPYVSLPGEAAHWQHLANLIIYGQSQAIMCFDGQKIVSAMVDDFCIERRMLLA